MTPQYIWDILMKIQNEKPLVHCITNMVTVNDCANILLAAGASPTMAHHPLEVEEVTKNCRSLVLNMGATEYLDAMFAAGKCALRLGHPIVLDPVGVAGSTFRRNSCLDLLKETRPMCIRGNFSEIKALLLRGQTGAGVDECQEGAMEGGQLETSMEIVQELAKAYNTIVIASGKTDLISDGTITYAVSNGTRLMARITGSGCMSSALLGAFLAVDTSVEAAAACCIVMGLCGERAKQRTMEKQGGTGTFHVELLDAISLLQQVEIEQNMKCREI